ncbi:MAG: hypothetical protein QXG35_06210 [Nitrososphaerota archaeon]
MPNSQTPHNVVYNICSNCGKKIKTKAPHDPELLRWLKETNEAVCNVCDPASSWVRAESDNVIITYLEDVGAILIEWEYRGTHHVLIPSIIVNEKRILEYVEGIHFAQEELEKVWRTKVLPELRWWIHIQNQRKAKQTLK